MMTDHFEIVEIPLMMFSGNMEALLENNIDVERISFRHYGKKGVQLMVEMTDSQKEEARKVGFKTRTRKKNGNDG